MEIPVIKNNEYVVDIIDNGFEGEGIAKRCSRWGFKGIGF